MSARVSSLLLDFFLSIRSSLSPSFHPSPPLPTYLPTHLPPPPYLSTYLPTNQPISLPPLSLGFVRQGREVRRRLAAGSHPALRQIEAEEAAWAAAGYEAHLHLRPGGAPPPPQRRARNFAGAMSCARSRIRANAHARSRLPPVRIARTHASAYTRKQARTHASKRARAHTHTGEGVPPHCLPVVHGRVCGSLRRAACVHVCLGWGVCVCGGGLWAYGCGCAGGREGRGVVHRRRAARLHDPGAQLTNIYIYIYYIAE